MEMLKLPTGFRFNPTDKQLMTIIDRQNYKLLGKPAPSNAIVEADVYDHSPWDLPGVGMPNKNGVWYFFTKRGTMRKVGNGCGFWKVMSSDEKIVDPREKVVIGYKRRLTYYCAIDGGMVDGNAQWTMKEYSLRRRGEGESDWVICKIKRKKTKCPRKTDKNMLEAAAAASRKMEDGMDKEKHEFSSITLASAASAALGKLAIN